MDKMFIFDCLHSLFFSAPRFEFKEPVEVKNFRHPTFPKNSSFVQLIKTVHSKPLFSKGHWRQTLTHSKKPNVEKFSKINAAQSILDDNDFKNYEDSGDKAEKKNFETRHVTTETPYDHLTLYYDDFSTLPNDASDITYEQVSMHE